jgi:hypothetical protein
MHKNTNNYDFQAMHTKNLKKSSVLIDFKFKKLAELDFLKVSKTFLKSVK